MVIIGRVQMAGQVQRAEGRAGVEGRACAGQVQRSGQGRVGIEGRAGAGQVQRSGQGRVGIEGRAGAEGRGKGRCRRQGMCWTGAEVRTG